MNEYTLIANMITLFVVFSICPVISGVIYYRKGHSLATGTFAGLLLGPFGILLVMLLPEKD